MWSYLRLFSRTGAGSNFKEAAQRAGDGMQRPNGSWSQNRKLSQKLPTATLSY